jgi:transposase InsO family protein
VAIPLTDVSAVACARAYATQIFARYGINEVLVTDKELNFMSTSFNELCNMLGVKQKNNITYHPQANGAVERQHRTMNPDLEFYVHAAGTNWNALFPISIMAYRSAPIAVMGYSAYYLLHRRERVIRNAHHLRAKLSPQPRRLNEAGWMQKLKPALHLVHKTPRERIY